MHLNVVHLEIERATGHIEPPQTGLRLTDELDGVIPMRHQILVPTVQRECIVLAEVLLIDHLEARVLDHHLDLGR